MRSWRGGMKKRCVVQEDKEQGFTDFFFFFFITPRTVQVNTQLLSTEIQPHPCTCNDSHTALTLPLEKQIKSEL